MTNLDLQKLYEIIAAILNLVSVPIVIITVLLLIQQTRHVSRQTDLTSRATRASVYQSVPETMIAIDKIFLERPELRKHFYGNEHIHQADDQYERTLVIAEIILDFMEHVRTISPSLPEYQWDSWERYFRFLYQSSPVLRGFWAENREWYPTTLQQFLDTEAMVFDNQVDATVTSA